MPSGQLLRQCFLACIAWGCAATELPQGVVRIDPRNPPKRLEGPMPGFGPFDSSSDALLAACPLILSQPRATAGRRDEQNFQPRWRVSTEYCAWLYYTPAGKYEMSMLVESTEPIPPDDSDERGCRMPAFVEDKRYPPHSLQYVYVLHNHPSPSILSDKDLRALINVARIHGRFIDTKEGKIPVGIVAFFANTYSPGAPVCDGFFEYRMGSTELLKWTPDEQGKWRREKVGTITWTSDTTYRFKPE
jgi:hypothetical protein